jgi:hypothetical protein
MKNITNKILYFIFFSSIIFFFKPSFIFKNDNTFREFGIGIDKNGYKKTLFNIFIINLIFIVFLVKISQTHQEIQ